MKSIWVSRTVTALVMMAHDAAHRLQRLLDRVAGCPRLAQRASARVPFACGDAEQQVFRRDVLVLELIGRLKAASSALASGSEMRGCAVAPAPETRQRGERLIELGAERVDRRRELLENRNGAPSGCAISARSRCTGSMTP
jgi:hypothetical protein